MKKLLLVLTCLIFSSGFIPMDSAFAAWETQITAERTDVAAIRNVIIGIADTASDPSTYEAPPDGPPPDADLLFKIIDPNLAPDPLVGVLTQIQADGADNYSFILAVDPNGTGSSFAAAGNVTLSWTPGEFGNGTYKLHQFDIDNITVGAEVVADMKTTTSYDVTGKTYQYFSIEFVPEAGGTDTVGPDVTSLNAGPAGSLIDVTSGGTVPITVGQDVSLAVVASDASNGGGIVDDARYTIDGTDPSDTNGTQLTAVSGTGTDTVTFAGTISGLSVGDDPTVKVAGRDESGNWTSPASSFTITVSASDVDPASTFEITDPSPVTSLDADGSAAFTFQITATNKSDGSAAGGKDVVMSVEEDATGLTFEPASPVTDGSGIATITLKSTKAGPFTVKATVDGVLLSTTIPVTFDPGTATKLRLTATPNTVNTNGADTAELKAEALDDNDNVDTSYATDITFSISQTGALVVFDDGTTADKAVTPTNGVATVVVKGDSANTDTGNADIGAASGTLTAATPVTIQVIDKTLTEITIETVPAGTTTTTVGEKIQFKATGTYDDDSEEVITDTVTWADSATKGEFSTTTKGEFLAKADGTTDITASLDGVTSTAISLTIAPPPALAFDITKDTVLSTETMDLDDFVSGGSGSYTFSFDANPGSAGSIDTENVFSIDTTAAFAGVYTIKVTDDNTAEELTDTFTVAMVLSPTTFSKLSNSDPVDFTINGAPAGTGFTITLSDGTAFPTDGSLGTFGAFADGGTPGATATYTVPSAITATQEFSLKFTADDSALTDAGLNTLTSATYTIIPVVEINGLVTGSDTSAAIENATVTVVINGAIQKTAADGTFTVTDLPATIDSYDLTISALGYTSQTVTYPDDWATSDAVKEIVLLADANSAGISGTVTDSKSGDPIQGATIKIDGVDWVEYTAGDGTYSFVVPGSVVDAGNALTVNASKGGYNTKTETGVSVSAGATTTLDIALTPVTIISIVSSQTGVPAGFADFIITGTSDNPFTAGASSEIQVTLDDGTVLPVTTTAGTVDALFNSGGLWVFRHAAEVFTFTVEADITNDDGDVSTNPEMNTTRENFCYVPTSDGGQRGAIVAPDSPVDSPYTKAFTIQSESGAMSIVVEPGTIPSSVTSLTAEIFEADPAAVGDGSLTGSQYVYQVDLFDQDGVEVSAFETGKTLTISLQTNLTTPTVQLFKADSLCALASGITTDISADITSVANGVVTFTVDSLSAFGISGVQLTPTILLSPASGVNNVNTTVTVTGTNFAAAFDASTTVTLGGASVTPTVVNATTLTFVAPASGTTGAVAVLVTNGTQSAPANFTYTSAPTQPVAPTANFEADKTTVAVDEEVQFTNTSSAGSGITSRSWDFGDGSTSTSSSPTHAYSEAGTYTVKLTVSGPGGSDSETKTDYITVVGATKPSFSASLTKVVKGTTVTFVDTSEGSVSRTWTVNGEAFGSGAESVEYIFDEAGTFTVKLTVTGADGNQYPVSQQIEVVEMPEADFDFTIDSDGLTISFTNKSVGNVSQTWQFGDGESSAEIDPVHTYAQAGEFEVVLTIASEDSQTDSITRTVDVPGPGGDVPVITADFSVDKTSGSAPLTVQFTDKSGVTNTTLTAWEWEFGDGETSTLQNPSHDYEEAGTYTVRLTVSNAAGLSNVKKVADYITVVIDYLYDAPILVSPTNSATDMALLTTLEIGALPTGMYALWEIATTSGFDTEDLVWREVNQSSELEIPEFILEAGASEYWWRVRVVDENETPKSDWSEAYRFVTVAVASDDLNSDGVVDDQAVENASAIFPDVNMDGIVKFVKAAVGDGVFGLEGIDKVTEIVFLKAFGTDAVSLPSDTEMAWGLIGYKVEVATAGATAKVKIHFSEAVSAEAKWLAYQVVQGWQDFSVYSEFSADRKSVTLTLRDGGFGDVDGIENGIIVVPTSGFGTVKTTTVVETSGGGGSDTCFIGAASQGGFGAGFALLTLLAGAVSAFCMRKRTK